jgi:hypothetical protein
MPAYLMTAREEVGEGREKEREEMNTRYIPQGHNPRTHFLQLGPTS